jgi:hypothetical protein
MICCAAVNVALVKNGVGARNREARFAADSNFVPESYGFSEFVPRTGHETRGTFATTRH